MHTTSRPAARTVRLKRWLSIALLSATALLTGCESDDDSFNHTPPPGQGSLIIDNNGDMNVTVYVDGVKLGETKDGKWSAFDLLPGVHRVVLDESNGDSSFFNYIDILEGQQTILTVTGSVGNELIVYLAFD
jgi:hypothetical protein